MTFHANQYPTIIISLEDVDKALSKIKASLAKLKREKLTLLITSVVCYSIMLLRHCCEQVVPIVTHLFQLSIDTQIVPNT